MKTLITRKEYCKVTNCSSDFRIPNFEFEEVCEFLENLGYEIVLHKAIVKIKETIHEDCEVRETGKTWDGERTAILAVKPNKALPDRLDSEEGKNMGFSTVFNKEIKKKLLGI